MLSDEFYREIISHPIPADLEAIKVLRGAPAVLDVFMWLSYRCFLANGREMIPLSGPCGLASQIGSIEYARPRRFREKLDGWLEQIRVLWPESYRLCNYGAEARPASVDVVGSQNSFL